MELPSGLGEQAIQDVLKKHPAIGAILERHDIGCVSCAVGVCLLGDVVSIHALGDEAEAAIEAEIKAYLSGAVQQAAPSGPLDVTAVMVEEHRLILRMVALVERNAAAVEQGSFTDWRFFLDAVDFIRHYADRFHHAKEEDVLFVALVHNGMPEKRSPIEAMLTEHDQGRAFVLALEAAAMAALDGVTGQSAAIARAGRGWAELLRGHIQKEDEILYPLAERVLPPEVRPVLVAAYEAAAGDGSLEAHYRALVERWERMLEV